MSTVIYDKRERAPVRNPKHLAWVRTFPCILGCGRNIQIEACHTPGERGLSQKPDDRRAVPMCVLHHRDQHAVGWKRFIENYDLDLYWWIDLFSAKPHLSCVDGEWHAIFTQIDSNYDSVIRIGERLDLGLLKYLRREWLLDYPYSAPLRRRSEK